MATNNFWDLQTDERKSESISNKKYQNLNLNQNHKCSNELAKCDKSSQDTKSNRHCNSNNDACAKKDVPWRDKMKWTSSVLDTELKRPKEEKHINEQKNPKNTSNSTFSLHIAAYEKSREETDLDSQIDADNELVTNKGWKKITDLTSIEENSFEFPRQQENDNNGNHELMEFRANQRLFNPNEAAPGNTPRRISMIDRLTIHESNASYREIAAQVGHSVGGVWYAKKRSQSRLSLKNRPKRIIVPENQELMRAVDEAVDEEHVFIHRKEIGTQLSHLGYNLTLRQISTIAAYDGLYIARSKFQQMISARNKDLRIFYREHVIATNQFFYNHVFVDECKIVTGHHGKFEWRRLETQIRKHPRVAHRSGFTIFGGISRRGPTPFLIIPGNVRVNSEYYCNMIGHSVYPFMRDVYNMDCSLVQDSAPIHVSRYTREFLDNLGIRRSFFPPQSPDYTGIEHVWRSLKHYVSQKNPTTLEELHLCIAEFVRTKLTVEFCNQLIDYSRKNILRSVDGRNYEGINPTEVLYRDAH